MLGIFKRKDPLKSLSLINQNYNDISYYSLAINHESTCFQVVVENGSKSIIDFNKFNNKHFLQIINDNKNLFRSNTSINNDILKKLETFRHFPMMSIIIKEVKKLKEIKRVDASEDEIKAYEWIKLSIDNVLKAIEKVDEDKDKILNMSYFYQSNSQLLNLFNLSFALKIVDNSLQVMYFEDSIVEGQKVKSNDPKWIFNFRTYHPEVMDLFTKMLNQCAKIELKDCL